MKDNLTNDNHSKQAQEHKQERKEETEEAMDSDNSVSERVSAGANAATEGAKELSEEAKHEYEVYKDYIQKETSSKNQDTKDQNVPKDEESILFPETAIGLQPPNVKEPGILKTTLMNAGEMIGGIMHPYSHTGRQEEQNLKKIEEERTDFTIEHPPAILNPYADKREEKQQEREERRKEKDEKQRENTTPRQNNQHNIKPSKSTPVDVKVESPSTSSNKQSSSTSSKENKDSSIFNTMTDAEEEALCILMEN